MMHDIMTTTGLEPDPSTVGSTLEYVRRNTGECLQIDRGEFTEREIEETRGAIADGGPVGATGWYISPLSWPAGERYVALQLHESGDLVSLLWVVWGKRISSAIWTSLDSMPRVPGVVLRQPGRTPWMAEIVAASEETMPPERLAWATRDVRRVAKLAAWAVMPS